MNRAKLALVFSAGIVIGVAGTILALRCAERASAAEKSSSKVVLENDRVRVKEAIFMPGDKKPGMHTHQYPHVGVIIDGGTLRFNYPDGKNETLELNRGGVGYREANVTHEAVNMGNRPVRVIEVEIK
jgi:mannose-6-phosphate isomerase-like protein (cupin superfamily)